LSALLKLRFKTPEKVIGSFITETCKFLRDKNVTKSNQKFLQSVLANI
jgi:hypothetical protein